MNQDDHPFDVDEAMSELTLHRNRLIIWLALGCAYILLYCGDSERFGMSSVYAYADLILLGVCVIWIVRHIRGFYTTRKQIRTYMAELQKGIE